MTVAFGKGRYGIRLAQTAADREACQALRHLCFFGRPGLDSDSHDRQCRHVMVADAGGLVATCRILLLGSGQALGHSYAAARYDLTRLAGYPAPILELGRVCIAPRAQDADVMRLIWGMLAQQVDAAGATLLIGCTSFAGTDPAPYRAAFGHLARRHLAPAIWAPGMRAPEVVRLDARAAAPLPGTPPLIPPLLRSYLGMGGWVSDHAVVDREMQTLHVFTGLEIASIPPRRAAALRATLAA